MSEQTREEYWAEADAAMERARSAYNVHEAEVDRVMGELHDALTGGGDAAEQGYEV